MANTLNDLYFKYLNKVSRSLETDRYFQYLFEMVMAGENVLKQSNQIMHKKVDERWLKMVEEAIPSIDTIVNKPRRYIATDEELVPVDLAKKITADSVRHLSMNTQFIAGVDGDNIMPSKILNVTTRESYDLYENRFVYTLIKKLLSFIDKRTDIIFWSTGDEKASLLSIESKVDDAYEQIEYKMEMRVKNKQSYVETDEQHMEVFKRIDRVRRVVNELNNSSFCQLMDGCSTVHSPIQKTNLLTKDHHYKKCMLLWQFLESYTDVGYSIEVKDTALEFDEEYLYQLYTNMLTNYTVFKSILDSDPRRIEEARPQRVKKIKPKFVKKVVEQIVDDYDIPDVEIRKVIIEEITKAQLELEKKEAEKARLAEKKAKEKARIAEQKAKEKAKIKAEQDKKKAREKAIKDKEIAAEKARIAKEREKERLAKQKAAEIEKAKKAKELEKARLAKQKAAEIEKAKKAKELEKARLAKQKAAEIEKAKKAKELEKARLAKQKAAEIEKAKKAKEREKARLAKQKAAEAEKAKKAKEREKAKSEKTKTVAKKKSSVSEAAAISDISPSIEEEKLEYIEENTPLDVSDARLSELEQEAKRLLAVGYVKKDDK